MSTMLGLVTALALALVVVLGTVALLRATRLDRLHVRTDAARAALIAALDRRAVVTRLVAASPAVPPDTARRLRRYADAAEFAPSAYGLPDREAAENDLTKALQELDRHALDRDLAAELSDADQRMVIARRVHTDAVRDTQALRGRRLVRWLRLAGTARPPRFFEIADPGTPPPPPGTGTGTGTGTARRSGRVVLLDERDRVLLLQGVDPRRPQEPFWFTVGGGLQDGEELCGAAARELREETGVRLDPAALLGPLWRREVVFTSDGRTALWEEYFFAARSPTAEVDTSGFTELERDTVLDYRWWTEQQLRDSQDVIYPLQLADLLPQAATALRQGWDGVTRPAR
jgi:8-oxo-dGTP pyrophosphatase MutT (NUDIX family)